MKWKPYILPCALAFTLAGCAESGHGSAYPQCIALRQWTDDDQDRLRVEVGQLPSDSLITPVIIDYYRMRNDSRACSRAVADAM